MSSASKDPSTKVGCIITDEKNRVVSMGYNGFPRGINDDLSLLNNREEKLKRVIHAEPNAIVFAKEDLSNKTIYTYPFAPCSNCCSLIIQSGITRVVSQKPTEAIKQRWADSLKVTYDMLQEAGIEFVEYDIME